MANTDCFALTASPLNPFLFAEVGTELNGATLTVLSVLARQGKDAWAEAANWTRLPRAGVIEALAGSIAAMPLTPRDHAAARATAARLVLLLPLRAQAAGPPARQAAASLQGLLPEWLPVRLIFVALAIALGINLLVAHHAPPAGPVPIAASAQPAPPTGSRPSPALSPTPQPPATQRPATQPPTP